MRFPSTRLRDVVDVGLLFTAMVVASSCGTQRHLNCGAAGAAAARVHQLVALDWRVLGANDAVRLWSDATLRRSFLAPDGRCEMFALACGAEGAEPCAECDTLIFAALPREGSDECRQTLDSVIFTRTADSYGKAIAIANELLAAAIADETKLLRAVESEHEGPYIIMWDPQQAGAPFDVTINFRRFDRRWVLFFKLSG